MSESKVQGGLPPPDGVVPNFEDPPQQVPAFFLVIRLCMVFSTLFVAMRVIVRTKIAKPMYWDDYFSVLGCVGLVGYLGLGILALQTAGAGIDQWNLPLDKVMRYAQLANDANIIYGVLNTINRLSIAFLLRRLFVVDNTWTIVDLVLHLVIWFNILLYTAHTFIMIFPCHPREKVWNPEVPGTCVNLYALFTFTSVANIITDLIFLLLPIRMVWRLQMKWRRKIGVTCIFLIGLLSFASTIIRMVFTLIGASNSNQTVAETTLWLWVYVELTSTLVVGCMPIVPPLFARVIGASRTSQYNSDRSGPSKDRSRHSMRGSIGAPRKLRHVHKGYEDTRPFSTLYDSESGEPRYELSPTDGATTTKIHAEYHGRNRSDLGQDVTVVKEFEVSHV